MIVLDTEKNRRFYFCESANWKIVVAAEDENQAAKIALKSVMDNLKDESLISYIVRVKRIKEDVEFSDYLITMEEVLADIGMHKEARALKEIIDNDRNKRVS